METRLRERARDMFIMKIKSSIFMIIIFFLILGMFLPMKIFLEGICYGKNGKILSEYFTNASRFFLILEHIFPNSFNGDFFFKKKIIFDEKIHLSVKAKFHDNKKKQHHIRFVNKAHVAVELLSFFLVGHDSKILMFRLCLR